MFQCFSNNNMNQEAWFMNQEAWLRHAWDIPVWVEAGLAVVFIRQLW